MTDFVLDVSVALAWCFKHEKTTAGDRVPERLADEAASVPAIWHREIANVLALSERRGRITPANSSEFIALLETLVIVIDVETPSGALGRVLDLARAERLTAYDAANLELAMRLGIPLASKDADLCDAAECLGARVLLNGQSLKAHPGGNIAPQKRSPRSMTSSAAARGALPPIIM